MRIAKDFPRDAVVVGVDLGGTNMQIGVVDAEGRDLHAVFFQHDD